MVKKSLQILSLATSLVLISPFSNAQKTAEAPGMPEDWTRDYEPFRMAGNLYYVGTYDLACYLITTPKGHILINSGAPGSARMIMAHVKALGFKTSDIKILLATHAHYDHAGGMAEIKKITGAKMMIHERDAPVLEDGGKSDYVLGTNQAFWFKPVKADRLLHDHDTVSLGGMQITVLHHPGHTKGACSFAFTVSDTGKSYRILIANMPSILDDTRPGMPKYPEVAKDYGHTLAVMKRLEFDLWFASHASQFNLHKKRQPGDAYDPNAFIDRQGYDSSIDDLQNEYAKKFNSNN